MTDIIVVGGGPAGVTAALQARKLGAKGTLVERGRMIVTYRLKQVHLLLQERH